MIPFAVLARTQGLDNRVVLELGLVFGCSKESGHANG